MQPTSLHSNLLIHFRKGDTSPRVYLELASTHGVDRGWSADFSSKYISVKLCFCVCNVFWWQGSDSEVECVAPHRHWRIGRNFLLPRIPRPALLLLLINPIEQLFFTLGYLQTTLGLEIFEFASGDLRSSRCFCVIKLRLAVRVVV